MDYVVEGSLSTKAVIKAKRRPVLKVLINKNKKSRDISYIDKITKAENIDLFYVDENEIEKYAKGKTHGGVVAVVGERSYQDLNDLTQGPKPFIGILEGIEDPFNFAYCLRSLYAAGCDGVIVGQRNWTTVVDVVTKSSAGASEFINVYQSVDLADTIQKLKALGFTIYGANRKMAKSLYKTQFDDKIVVAIGGEKRGLSNKVAKLCDYNIYIPYANDFKNAINGSGATAIISFEIFRQRSLINEKKD